ncbi:hypothetical protein ACQJBY_018064 [Aegilops geniculata]
MAKRFFLYLLLLLKTRAMQDCRGKRHLWATERVGSEDQREGFIQKIPKVVVSSLRSFVDMPISARISLEAYLGDTHVIMPSSFKLCKQDGTMVIEKTSFSEFI